MPAGTAGRAVPAKPIHRGLRPRTVDLPPPAAGRFALRYAVGDDPAASGAMLLAVDADAPRVAPEAPAAVATVAVRYEPADGTQIAGR